MMSSLSALRRFGSLEMSCGETSHCLIGWRAHVKSCCLERESVPKATATRWSCFAGHASRVMLRRSLPRSCFAASLEISRSKIKPRLRGPKDAECESKL